MIRAIAPVASLLLGVAILLTGQGLQGVLLPVRATLENFSAQSVGLIGGAYFLGFTFGCWKGAAIIQRAGHVRVFAAMTAIASASPLLQGLWVNLWSWGILRFTTGFCFAVLYVVIESWLNEKATNENRGIIFSAYILINMTVLAVGQQMLLAADPKSLNLFALVSVLVSVAAVPLLMSNREEPDPVQEAEFALKPLYRNSPSGLFGCLTSGLANGSFWALAPVFVAAYTQDISLSAWFMTSVVLGGAASQWPLGWWSDRVDRRYVLIFLCLAGAVTGGVMGMMDQTVGIQGILLLGFVWGAVAFPVYSISVALANDWAEPDTFVQISSGLLLTYGAGAITGPLVASALMEVTGSRGLYLFTAITHLLLAAYIGQRVLRRKQAPLADHKDFNDAIASALTSSTVYEEEMEAEDGEQAA